KELAARVKHQLRRIPELKFFLDDTLDQVFKMEELFEKIKKEESKNDNEEEKG
ncbi:MAG: ribosome-binding factor A, partial [Chitinophagaceae bacterium]